jgi:hypothetical protein
MKVGFQYRFKDHLRGHLGDPVGHRGYPKRAHAPVLLGYLHPSYRIRMVAAGGHSVPELVQIVLQTLLKALHREPIYTGRVTVCLYTSVGFQNQTFRYLVRFCFLQSVPPFRLTSRENRVTQPLRSTPITGLLRYYGLFRPCAALRYFLSCRGFRLRFSLSIAATGSHVPHNSLTPVHAAFMPEAACPVHRFPACSCHDATLVRRFRPHYHAFDTSTAVHFHSSPGAVPDHGVFPRPLTGTFTTAILYRSSFQWFGTRSCKPIPRDLPSSVVQFDTSFHYAK